jgi:hypothetical protein
MLELNKARDMRGLHNGEDLEEIVLGEVLVRVVRVQGPEVVDQKVEDAEDDDEHNGAELGLESNDDHNAGNEPKQANTDPPEAPVATEDEADEEEDEQDTTSELEVHLAVLLIESRETSRGKLLADPRVGKHHQEAPHDGQVAQEEVEVEDQPVSKTLEHHHTDEAEDAVVRVLSCDDHDGADGHSDYVRDQEQVGEAVGDCDTR